MTAPDHLAAASEAARAGWTARIAKEDLSPGDPELRRVLGCELWNKTVWNAAFNAGYQHATRGGVGALQEVFTAVGQSARTIASELERIIEAYDCLESVCRNVASQIPEVPSLSPKDLWPDLSHLHSNPQGTPAP